MRKKILAGIFVLFFFCIITDQIAETVPEGQKKINPGQVASHSLFGSATSPENSGISSNSVNLYTGQHTESFPLVALQGRVGFALHEYI